MAKLKHLIDAKPPELPEHPSCAFCGSKQTEFMSLFGQFLLVSQYYCHHCHSVFEWCKHQGEQASEGAEVQRSGGAGGKGAGVE